MLLEDAPANAPRSATNHGKLGTAKASQTIKRRKSTKWIEPSLELNWNRSVCGHVSPLVMKEPFLLRAESLLEVESQRSRGSDSSGKKPLVRSTGDCSKPMPLTRPMLLLLSMLIGDSVGFWIGLCLLLTFPEVISWLTSNCKYEGGVESEEKKRKMMRRGIEKKKKSILGDWWKWLLMTIWLMIYGT